VSDPEKPEEKLHLLEPEVVRGLLARLRLARLLERFPERPMWALFMLVNGFVTIAILAALAAVSATPFVFPSLGPTAFLFFFTPSSPTASPRHALYGHAIGIACGYGALLAFGLEHAPPAAIAGVDLPRIGAAALSLAATGAFMILLKAAHPPAGATTLIISLGIVTRPFHLLVIEIAVGLLALQAIAINRLAGLDYPLWAKRTPEPQPEPVRFSLTILAVVDLDRAARFYSEAFGFSRAVDTPVYVEFALPSGMRLGVYQREGFARNTGEAPVLPPPGALAGTELYFHATDVAAAAERVCAAGGRLLSPLAPRPWGDEAAYFADLDGNVVVVARRLEE
jgi:predicted enzyme related to lactoylglutathione lyase